MKHNAVVVTGWNEKNVKAAHKKAKELYREAFSTDIPFQKDGSILISDIITGVANDQLSFFIAPDGSKEGWMTSDLSDKVRKEFLDWLLTSDNYCHYIEVRFGGDDEYESIKRSRHKDLDKMEDIDY